MGTFAFVRQFILIKVTFNSEYFGK